MQHSDTIKEIAAALAKFQAEVGNVAKDATNPFYKSKYATLENVISTARPFLAKHGLSFAQFPQEKGLTTILMHTSGEYLEAWSALVMKDETPQGQGSALTYLRRYALSAVLGIATEDDDDANSTVATKPAATGQTSANAAKPVPPTAIEKARNAKKKRIAELCDAKAHVPLFEAVDYATYVTENTGLTLEPQNYDTIIERLEALQ